MTRFQIILTLGLSFFVLVSFIWSLVLIFKEEWILALGLGLFAVTGTFLNTIAFYIIVIYGIWLGYKSEGHWLKRFAPGLLFGLGYWLYLVLKASWGYPMFDEITIFNL